MSNGVSDKIGDEDVAGVDSVRIWVKCNTVWPPDDDMVSHSERCNIHILINSTYKADKFVKPYMINSQGKYLDSVGNIWVNLPCCVLCEVLIYTSYPFWDNF